MRKRFIMKVGFQMSLAHKYRLFGDTAARLFLNLLIVAHLSIMWS